MIKKNPKLVFHNLQQMAISCKITLLFKKYIWGHFELKFLGDI